MNPEEPLHISKIKTEIEAAQKELHALSSSPIRTAKEEEQIQGLRDKIRTAIRKLGGKYR